MFYDPDLTGQDPGCRVENDVYTVHKHLTRIEFAEPIYLEGISITTVETVPRPLTKDLDWKVETADLDDTMMARMKTYDSEWEGTLIKALIIQKPYTSQYKINIVHQRLYPVDVKKSLLLGRRVEFTPDMLGNMLEQLNYLMMITSPVTDVHSLTGNEPRLYDVDMDMSNPANVVEEEAHEVNVLEGRRIIRPIAGSFYKQGLVVSIKDNPDPMVFGTDYIVFGTDLAKTRTTSNEGGVYNFIMILKEIVGQVEIDYHAYGGEATIYDVDAVNKKVNNITDFLQESSFMTADALGTAPIIVALNEKVLALEADMRKLYEQHPTYGDVTYGSSALKKLVSNDANLHWYSIATLFKFEGSDEIVTADRMHFRLSSLELKFMFDVMVNVNINNPNDPLTVNVLSENYPKGFVPFVDYSQVDDIVRPQLRVIYNNNEHQNSGIILQLGLELKTLNAETVVIEDLSGKESVWKLIPTVDNDVSPDDDVVTLPSEEHIWDLTNPDSVAISTLVPFKDGYIAWAGSESLNRPEGGIKELSLPHLLPNNIDISKINKVRVELQEAGGRLFPVEVAIIPGGTDTLGTGHYMYNGLNATLSVNLRKELDPNTDEDAIFIDLISNVDVANQAPELQLKHLFIFTG